MRIHLLSDCHCEFGRLKKSNYTPPECDVVVLSGDIWTGVQGVMWAQQTFEVPVVYCAGNHEHYHTRPLFENIQALRDKATGSHVHFLENDTVMIQGVRFIGATLWTDYDLFGTKPLAMMKAEADMNDFERIKKGEKSRMLAEDFAAIHSESRFYISEELRKPHDGKTVVVTHHAPSSLSLVERYRHDPLSAAYASRLEDLILDHGPALWTHGHLHDSRDYELGDTRIVCNPRGYEGHHLNPDFDPGLVIEI